MNNRIIMKNAALAAVIFISFLSAALRTNAAPGCLKDWPEGSSPAEAGKRVAENFCKRGFEFERGLRATVIYPEVCAWYGSLKVAGKANDTDLESRLITKFDPFFDKWTNRIPREDHVDYKVFGVLPMEISLLNHDPRYKNLGLGFADSQWDKPTADGITHEARYWVDDMFMITALQVKAFQVTGDKTYLDRAALTMEAYLKDQQQTNGLFFHAKDSPFYWCRGNGWFAVGMTELLAELPENHPKRAAIMAGYSAMMNALLKYQGEDGLWHQLIDTPESFTETSGSGMFTFAMSVGVQHGWLDEGTFCPAVRKAWLGLVKHLDADGNLDGVCEGTNKAFKEVGADAAAQRKFYLARKQKKGDLHGQSAFLWAAASLMEQKGQ